MITIFKNEKRLSKKDVYNYAFYIALIIFLGSIYFVLRFGTKESVFVAISIIVYFSIFLGINQFVTDKTVLTIEIDENSKVLILQVQVRFKGVYFITFKPTDLVIEQIFIPRIRNKSYIGIKFKGDTQNFELSEVFLGIGKKNIEKIFLELKKHYP